MAELMPGIKFRQVITGFPFGGTGAAIALSAIGKESGAHLNLLSPWHSGFRLFINVLPFRGNDNEVRASSNAFVEKYY